MLFHGIRPKKADLTSGFQVGFIRTDTFQPLGSSHPWPAQRARQKAPADCREPSMQDGRTSRHRAVAPDRRCAHPYAGSVLSEG